MNADLRLELKTLIIEACDKDCEPASIGDDELLFGPEAPLQLDSLDALQVSMAIKKNTACACRTARKLVACFRVWPT